MAILTMGLMSAFNLTSMSFRRSIKAMNRWDKQHMLSQAAEFYLLAGPRADITDSVFPYDDYTVSCEVIDPEGLPDEATEDIGEWRLACLNIQLSDDNGKVVDSLKVDRIMHKDDL